MLLRKLSAYVIYSAVVLISSQTWSTPNAHLVASRLQGPAPLSVSFDATGTTSSDNNLDPFRQTGYHFVFDDQNSGRWEHSDKSKNEQIGGPIAAHVFDDPGTYEVELRVQEPDGTVDSEHVTITVTDPDEVFSENDTVVISRNNDTTGAPAGAQLITNATRWPSWESGKRYLLRAGQDFTALGNIDIRQRQDIQVDKFGSGSDPTVNDVVIEGGGPSEANWSARITIRHMNAVRVYAGLGTDHVLFYQNFSANNIDNGTLTEWTAKNEGSNALSFALRSQINWPTNFFIVENTVSNPSTEYTNGAGSTGFGGRGCAWMGNSLTSSFSHSVRMWFGYKTFFGHNYLAGTPEVASITAHLKMHSSGTGEYGDRVLENPIPASRYVVIADNMAGDGDENRFWSINTSPQNSDTTTEEGLQDIIVENNTFDREYSGNVTMSGRNMIERGNRVENGGTLNVGRGHTAASGWEGLYHWREPVVEAIILVDPDGDSDNDGVPDDEDAFPNNSAAAIDDDNDGYPDEWLEGCDEACRDASGLYFDHFPGESEVGKDTDNDGMPDEWSPACDESCQSASDWTLDPLINDGDNDGVEDSMDSDPSDNGPPLITVQDDIALPSEGDLTAVDIGEPDVSDYIDPDPDVYVEEGDQRLEPNDEGLFEFAPGRHNLTWVAVDASNNPSTAQQVIDIYPQVSFSQVEQLTGEGVVIDITVQLNGVSPEYPVPVAFEADRVGSTTDNDDHDFDMGERVMFEIPEGDGELPAVSATYQISIFDDEVLEPTDEKLVLALVDFYEPSQLWTLATEQTQHTVTVTDTNLAPQVNLIVQQGGGEVDTILLSGGEVSLTADVSDANGDDLSLSWDLDSLGLDAPAGNVLTFDPINLAEGDYPVVLTATELERDEPLRGVVEVSLALRESEPNQAPEVALRIEQGGEAVQVVQIDGGSVTVFAEVTDNDGDSATLTWDLSTLDLDAPTGDELTFSPAGFSAGDYILSVTATDDRDSQLTGTASVTLTLKAAVVPPVNNDSSDSSGGGGAASATLLMLLAGLSLLRRQRNFSKR
jgi:PKD domain